MIVAAVFGLSMFLLGLVTVVWPARGDLGAGSDLAAFSKVTRTTTADGAVTEVTEPASVSSVERVLAPGGTILLRVAAMVGLAYVVAGLAARAVLGRFGFKAGSVELEDLDLLKSTVSTSTESTTRSVEGLEQAIEALGREQASNVRDTAAVLEFALRRLDEVDRRVVQAMGPPVAEDERR